MTEYTINEERYSMNYTFLFNTVIVHWTFRTVHICCIAHTKIATVVLKSDFWVKQIKKTQNN